MTETTHSRQITKLLEGVLKKNNVFLDEQDFTPVDREKMTLLWYDILGAMKEYIYCTRGEKRDKTQVRKDILAAYETGTARADKREAMIFRTRKALGINPAGERYTEMIDFLITKDEKGQTIELYAAWLEISNQFSKKPAPFKITERPSILKETWPSAFVEYESTKKDGFVYV